MALAAGAAALIHSSAHAAVHRAALVIEHDASWPGARVVSRCMEFAQDAISGLMLLELAGVNSGQPPQVYDWGAGAVTVCQINGEPGAVPDRCFGPVSGPNWSDWSSSSTGWEKRGTGVTGYTLRDGDLEGWSYSSGFGAPPPAADFTQVCAPRTLASAHPTAVAARPTITPTLTGSPVAKSSPGVVAVLPSTALSQLPETAAAAAPAATANAPPIALVLFAASIIVLFGLAAWNLIRRAP